MSIHFINFFHFTNTLYHKFAESTFWSLNLRLVQINMKKQFSELSRSQKNRRLKILRESFDRSNSAGNILNISKNNSFVESEQINFGSFESELIELGSNVPFAISECEFNIKKVNVTHYGKN